MVICLITATGSWEAKMEPRRSKMEPQTPKMGHQYNCNLFVFSKWLTVLLSAKTNGWLEQSQAQG